MHRLIDKLPLNILDAGLIKRVFPNAKFIHALRHPCDVCLGCFMQPFELNEGTVHFTRLDETVRFYAEVMGLWQTQREVLDLSVHDARYEDIVGKRESSLRNLLAFLDLSWDETMLSRPACAQRQPFIGTDDDRRETPDGTAKTVDRWRKYEIHLAPHLPRLRPFIKAFGYAG